MAREEILKLKGKVIELLPNATFRIKLENNHDIEAYTSGKMKKARIRVLVGDTVTVEMTPYDLTKGRVVHRQTGDAPPPEQVTLPVTPVEPVPPITPDV